MKNKRIFGERDFCEYFKKVLDRFEIKKEGVFLAAGDIFENSLSEDELAVLRPHPYKSRGEPALAFPFSYSDAEKIVSFYDLWDEVHMRRLCCASEEIMPLEQVAELLETDLPGIWALMQPQNDQITNQLLPVLQPSVFFDRVYLHWRGEGGEELGGDFHGLFDLFNSRGIQADSRGRVEISFLERKGAFYAVPSGRKKQIVNVSHVYVTRGELDNYLQAIGKPPLEEEGLRKEFGPPNGTAKEIVEPGSPLLPHSTEAALVDIVLNLFWKDLGPDFNRPTEDQIVGWLVSGYELTPKAARRIYQVSKPDKVQRHGNLPEKNPYPTPQHPPLPKSLH